MPEKEKQYLISVIPITRITLSRDQDFYYTYSKKIPFGSLVDIPFGRRRVTGVVIGCKSDFARVGGMQIKPIIKVLDESLVTRDQLKLARYISDHYLCPLGIVLKHMTPARTKMRTHSTVDPSLIEAPTIHLSQKEREVLHIITDARETHKIVVHDADLRRRQRYFVRIITELFSEGAPAQVLYLVPELTAIPSVEDLCVAQFGQENVVTLHSKLSKGAFYDAWEKIKNDDGPQVIIATRTGLFAPFVQLRTILVSDAEDISYKQWDMNPRYDARTCAARLGMIHKCPTLFASAAPRVVDRFDAEKNGFFCSFAPHKKPPITLINMCKEHWKNGRSSKKGHYEPISSSLKLLLSDSLKQRKTSLLFINRQGLNSFSICTQCKSVLRCPTCTRALVESQDGTFHCLHCTYQSDSFPSCPTCKNMTFRAVGVGTERIEKDIKKLFPKAHVLRIDTQSMQSVTAARKMYDKINSGAIDIVIGTQMITKSVFHINLGCVGVIDADAFFGTADFSVDEKAFSHLAHVLSLGRAHKAHVAIQTFSPEQRIIAQASENRYDTFYKEEIEDRKALRLPPFTHVVTMTYRSHNKRHARIMAEKMRRQFLDVADESKVSVQPVQKPLLDKVRGDYRRSVSLFIKPKHIPKEITTVMQKCDPAWIIDHEPIATI